MHRTTIRKQFDQLGIDPPAQFLVTERLEQAFNIIAASDPIKALAADLEAGKITTEKQAAQRGADATLQLAQREHANDVAEGLAATFVDMYKRSLRDGAEAIIDELRTTFDQAVATVVIATETLGPNPDDALVGSLGPAASIAWTDRKAAKVTLDAIRKLRNALAEARYGPPRVDVADFLATATDVPALEQARRVYAVDGIVSLAAAGYDLRLNTAAEAAQIEAGAALATEQADRIAREAAEAKAKENARSYEETWKAVADHARQQAQRRKAS